jgi:hypothetical protein
MTLIIIFNVVLMALVFVGIVSLLGAGIASNRRWVASLSSPVRRHARVRVSGREVAGRRQPRRGYVPAPGA